MAGRGPLLSGSAQPVVGIVFNRNQNSSCPCSSRASTHFLIRNGIRGWPGQARPWRYRVVHMTSHYPISLCEAEPDSSGRGPAIRGPWHGRSPSHGCPAYGNTRPGMTITGGSKHLSDSKHQITVVSLLILDEYNESVCCYFLSGLEKRRGIARRTRSRR